MDNNMDKYLGTCLDDRYEIVEVIGAGGMAVVYKAIDQRLNRFVAVKILRDELARDEEFRARFQIEAQAVAMRHAYAVHAEEGRAELEGSGAFLHADRKGA